MMALRLETQFRNRPGGIAVWVVMSIAVVIGVVALVMDGGHMMQERRRAQSAADAAALAAAANLYKHYEHNQGSDPDGDAARAARSIAKANGYAHNGSTVKVDVNVPPSQGAFARKTDYVEVIVHKALNRSFSQIFTGSTTVLKARAVAKGRSMKLGLVALKRSGSGTLRVDGVAAAAVGNSVIVNSDDTQALIHDSIGILQASSFDIVGNYVSSGLLLGKVRTGASPVADPLRHLPAPTLSDYAVQSGKKLVLKRLGLTILKPGVYQGGIEISGLAIVLLQPGEYILQGGGLEVKGAATVTGLGVMFYNTGDGRINISGLGKVVLNAPLTGTYRGMTIFHDRTSTQPVSITGIASTSIGGTIYAAKSHVTVNGGVGIGIITPGGAIVSDTIHLTGIGNISVDLSGNDPPAPEVHLAE